jgi:hypothetical protein
MAKKEDDTIKQLTARIECLERNQQRLEDELQYVRGLALYPRVYPRPFIPWLFPPVYSSLYWYSTVSTSVTVGDVEQEDR